MGYYSFNDLSMANTQKITNCNNLKKTTQLVYQLSELKKEELEVYEQKIRHLQDQLKINPQSSVIRYKLQMAKLRYRQLMKTAKGLQQLEQKIEFLNIFSGESKT
ncbi:hypothetical protein AB9K26_12480 [Psychroserpens sp. XS_ASV72]|uniref:hypothetical protein n=1 Tax=Psychroserpens sp. XS_ASV72 TaxID=3241293 RepID=UPI003512E269